jgi:hypothetical protein
LTLVETLDTLAVSTCHNLLSLFHPSFRYQHHIVSEFVHIESQFNCMLRALHLTSYHKLTSGHWQRKRIPESCEASHRKCQL